MDKSQSALAADIVVESVALAEHGKKKGAKNNDERIAFASTWR